MPTIKDIAKEADVSCGTVSNVLNKRGNVRADKIKRVEDAVKRLAYEVNESAKTLRQKHKRTIAVLIPYMHGQHYIDLYESVSSMVRPYDYTVEIHSTQNLFAYEKNLIKKMISANVNCIISFPTYICSDEIYNNIPKSIYLVIVGPHPTNVVRPYLNISFDYTCIGNDIVSYILSKKYKSAALFIDSVRFSEAFTMVIKNKLEKKGMPVTILGSTNRTAAVRAFDLLDKNTDYDVIITSNTLRANSVWKAYRSFGSRKIPEIITLTSSNSVLGSEYTSVYQDYTKLGNLLAENLIHVLVEQKDVPTSFVLSSDSIHRKQLNFPYLSSAQTLNVLVPEDLCLSSLQKLLPQFEKRSGIHVNLAFYPKSECRHILLSSYPYSFDILVADINYYPFLAENLYLSRKANPEFWRTLHGKVNADTTFFPDISANSCCFSFNTACQMLFYRQDIFNDIGVRRKYYEHSSYSELSVPETIDEYDAIARYFTRSYNPSAPLLYGTSMSSLDSYGFWGEFVWRIRASGAQLTNKNGRIHFDDPSVLDVIRQYFKSLKYSNVPHVHHTYSAVDEFIRGNSVFSVFSTASAPLFNDSKYAAVADYIRLSNVPGQRPVIDCNVIGVGKKTSHLQEAALFMQWAFHDTVSTILTLLSGQPIHKSSVTNAEILTLYPWLKHFNQTVASGALLSQEFQDFINMLPLCSSFVTAITTAYNGAGNFETVFSDAQQQYEALLEGLSIGTAFSGAD